MKSEDKESLPAAARASRLAEDLRVHSSGESLATRLGLRLRAFCIRHGWIKAPLVYPKLSKTSDDVLRDWTATQIEPINFYHESSVMISAHNPATCWWCINGKKFDTKENGAL